MEEKKMILVRNRNAGSTGYTFEDGFHRRFEFEESKKIPLEELRQLSFIPGGEYILKNCLIIEDKAALDYLNIEVEPEYFYSEEDIKKLLLEGTIDQLEDTLNFAPDGVIEMLKKIAVEKEIPDMRKRNLITEKTGFNINNAINVNHIIADGQDEEPKKEKPMRKATPINEKTSSQKKESTSANKYKVVSMKEE